MQPSTRGKAVVIVLLAVAIIGIVVTKHVSRHQAANTNFATQKVAPPQPQEAKNTAVASPSPAPSSKQRQLARIQSEPTSTPAKANDTSIPKHATSTPEKATADAPAPSQKSQPRLLELGADKCVPCRMMQPVLAELRQEYGGRLEVEFIDVWKNPEIGDQYGVQAIPTQILFDAKGKEVYRHTGYFAKEDIVAKFAELRIEL